MSRYLLLLYDGGGESENDFKMRMSEKMNDPRYKTDPSFQKSVEKDLLYSINKNSLQVAPCMVQKSLKDNALVTFRKQNSPFWITVAKPLT